MSRKEIALEAVADLSDNCTFEEIIERLQFVAGIQMGLGQLDRGEGIPHEQVMKELASWLSE